jgi:hypothetical protein
MSVIADVVTDVAGEYIQYLEDNLQQGKTVFSS